MTAPRKVYVLIDEKTGKWFGMCERQFPDQPGADVHQELWHLDKYENVVYAERVYNYEDSGTERLLKAILENYPLIKEVDLGNFNN